jgi:hypothetical protein
MFLNLKAILFNQAVFELEDWASGALHPITISSA